jgi:hypothetical protein
MEIVELGSVAVDTKNQQVSNSPDSIVSGTPKDAFPG